MYYIYVFICACMCVCVCFSLQQQYICTYIRAWIHTYKFALVCCTIHSRANEKLAGEGRKLVKEENRILADSLETFTNTGNDTPSSGSRAFTPTYVKVRESRLLNPRARRTSNEQYLFVLAAHFHARPPALTKRGGAEATAMARAAEALPLRARAGAD